MIISVTLTFTFNINGIKALSIDTLPWTFQENRPVRSPSLGTVGTLDSVVHL